MERTYLKTLRKEQGRSMADVAKCLGITTQYYCYIENGQRKEKMDVEMLVKLAKCFGVNPNRMMEEELRRSTR